MSKIIFINDYSSKEDALSDILDISKSQVRKKSDYKKKDLEKKVWAKREIFEIPLALFNYGHINPIYENQFVNIIFEDENFLVLDKPAKSHCHPLSYNDKNNILSFLRSRGHFEILKVNQAKYDRGLAHRLDYETSGVLIYCKTQLVYQEVFKNRGLVFREKRYLAQTKNINLKLGLYNHYIEEKGSKVKMHQEKSSFAQERVSLEVLSNHKGLLDIRLITGKRHQIRAQLACLGAPILGDKLYGGATEKRLMLHSKSYTLSLFGRDYEFNSDLSSF